MTRKRIVLIAAAAVITAVVILFIVFITRNEKNNKHTLDELKHELNSFKFEDTEKLHFDCKTPVLNSDDLWTVTNEVPHSFEKTGEEKASKFISDSVYILTGNEIDRSNISKDSEGDLYYQDNSCFFDVYPCGTFMFYKKPQYAELLELSENITDERTYTDFIQDTSDSKFVKIKGKDVDIKKASEYALSTVKSKMSEILNDNEDVELADAVCVNNAKGETVYLVIRLAHTLDGVRINENGFIDADPKEETSYIMPSYFRVLMTSENEIVELSNAYYYKALEKKKVDRIIGLSDAVKIADNELAKNLRFDVKAVSLKYAMQGTNKQYGQSRELRPMWSFVLEINGCHSFDVINTKTLFVDAIDGTVYYCDTASLECQKLESER